MVGAQEVLNSLWRRRWSFLTTVVVVLVAAGAVTYALPKVYESSSYLLVSSAGDTGSDFEATQTNQVLLKTYAELLQTRNVADAVASELPFAATGRSLQRAVEIKPITQSQLIAITAEASSPERAKIVADAYAAVFVERVDDQTEIDAGSARVVLAEEGAFVTTPARPRPLLNMSIGALLALVAGAAVALLRQRLDQRLEPESGATELLGLPIIGRFPRARTPLEHQSLTNTREPAVTELAEASRLLLANLSFANMGRRPRSLAVVSPRQGEGKSTCALFVARAAAELGLNVGLVDGDLRRPNLSELLGSESSADDRDGFSGFLLNPEALPLAIVGFEPGQSLHFIPAGVLPPNPAALLGSENLATFERLARSSFDLVVFDTPPLLVGADASFIAAATEGVLMVVDAWQTRRTAAVEALDQLKRAQSNILGVVLNRVPAGHDSYAYHHAPRRGAPVNGSIRFGTVRSRRLRARR